VAPLEVKAIKHYVLFLVPDVPYQD